MDDLCAVYGWMGFFRGDGFFLRYAGGGADLPDADGTNEMSYYDFFDFRDISPSPWGGCLFHGLLPGNGTDGIGWTERNGSLEDRFCDRVWHCTDRIDSQGVFPDPLLEREKDI